MIGLQKLVNLSLSGNRQNEYRLPLYFASGQLLETVMNRMVQRGNLNDLSNI